MYEQRVGLSFPLSPPFALFAQIPGQLRSLTKNFAVSNIGSSMQKKVHIHLGPHKTGSTAIQEYIYANQENFSREAGIGIVRTEIIGKINGKLEERNYEKASELVTLIAESCREDQLTCFVISSEDFSGDMPGRGNGRKPYPNLWRNIKIFEEAFHDFDCHYYFFEREKESWLFSAYIQSLKYRTKFKSFQEFKDHIDHSRLWQPVTEEARRNLGNRFHSLEWKGAAEYSSTLDFLKEASLTVPRSSSKPISLRVNEAPDQIIVSLLELINRVNSSRHSKKLAKTALLTPKNIKKTSSGKDASLTGKDTYESFDHELPDDLGPLWDRSQQQFYMQDQPDILPDVFGDWSEFRQHIINFKDEFPADGRKEIINQKKILHFRFNGYPEVCAILGLAVSYLRRNTPHTGKASAVFQRLWREEYPILLAVLPTRWLISTFQTFLDHGTTEEQKIIGAAGFYFGNLMKIYEGERSLEGLPADSIYAHTQPQTDNGFPGLDRFSLGGTDLLTNTLSHMVHISTKDDVSGRVLREFIMRMKGSHTVFSRYDQSRISHDIDIAQFANCWSFFEKPK